jgi:xanthine dehydrogenase YagR molybdenum-binding subunit
MPDGRDLVGYGMATTLLRAFRFPAQARVSIERAGQVRVETSTQAIGQGVSTVLPQVAADVLGVPVGRVALALGDTALPVAPFTGGSSGTISVGSAVQGATANLRDRLLEAGANGPEGYPGAVAAREIEVLSADGAWSPDEGAPSAALFSFGPSSPRFGLTSTFRSPGYAAWSASTVPGRSSMRRRHAAR